MSVQSDMKPLPSEGIVETNINLGADYFLLSVVISTEDLPPQPGQFYMIGLKEGVHPLLRRPLSVFKYQPFEDLTQRVTFLYKVVGVGTEILSRKRKGDDLSLLGPLGVPAELQYEKPILIAGGTGVATLHFLMTKYIERGAEVNLLYGANTERELIELDGISPEVIQLATIDGSCGHRGTVVELFQRIKDDIEYDSIYSCGPVTMLKSLNDVVSTEETPLFTSLESIMGCGVGACFGCAVPSSRGGYIHICEEGPLLSASEVKWDEID